MPVPISDQQSYDTYTPADYAVWQKLAERQIAALNEVACQEYLDCLTALHPVLAPAAPPRFTELNKQLRATHGWSIKVVPGLLPVDDFFDLLANRRFCSSTWLRRMDQLDYLEEPDMFHDIFGHIPLYLNKDYATFAERLGQLGVKYAHDEEKVTQLQRLYWFTIEFGVMRREGKVKVYGAGICSSYSEAQHIFENPEVEVVPFVLDEVLAQDFISTEVQMKYFVIGEFAELWAVVDLLEERWGE